MSYFTDTFQWETLVEWMDSGDMADDLVDESIKKRNLVFNPLIILLSVATMG